MGSTVEYAVSQEANVVPPRAGGIIALAIDATSRRYSLAGLAFANQAALVTGRSNRFFLTLENDGTNDIYYAFDASGSTSTISDTAILVAGSTLAFDALPITGGMCAKLPAGVWIDLRIDHPQDVTLIVKCAAGLTSTLRFWCSSQGMPGATQ